MDPSQTTKLASEAAIWTLQQAQECRAFARNGLGGDKEQMLRKAAQFDADARAALQLSGPAEITSAIGCGGEMAVVIAEVRRHVDQPGTSPDLVTVDASRTRLALAQGAGVLPLALDTAEAVSASNGVEQMLAHQIAAAHTTAMQLIRVGMGALKRHEEHNLQFAFLGTEGIRMLGASARLMEASQRAALTINRLKTAGKQTLVVQHVHVGDGGQAVVTGASQHNQHTATDDTAGQQK